MEEKKEEKKKTTKTTNAKSATATKKKPSAETRTNGKTNTKTKQKTQTKPSTNTKQKKEVKKEQPKENNEIKEKVKTEATNTVNQVKDTIKKVDIKKDSVETKGFVIDMIKNPVEKLQEIVKKQSAKFFTYAVILIAIWMSAELISECFSIGVKGYTRFFNSILELVKVTIAPALGILIMAIIIMVRNKNNKKSLTTIITALTAAKLPRIIVSILSLLTIISVEVHKVISPLTVFAGAISTIFVYFVIKSVLGKNNDKEALKEFVIIEAIYCVAYFLLSFLGIFI